MVRWNNSFCASYAVPPWGVGRHQRGHVRRKENRSGRRAGRLECSLCAASTRCVLCRVGHTIYTGHNTMDRHSVQRLKNQRDLCDQPCRNHILLLRCVLGVHLVTCNSVYCPHPTTGSTTVSAYHHTHLPVGVLLRDFVPQGVGTTIDRHLGKQNEARVSLLTEHTTNMLSACGHGHTGHAVHNNRR
jgi:hypothetical protein